MNERLQASEMKASGERVVSRDAKSVSILDCPRIHAARRRLLVRHNACEYQFQQCLPIIRESVFAASGLFLPPLIVLLKYAPHSLAV